MDRMKGEDHQVPVYASGSQVLQKLQEKWEFTKQWYPAMYSSVIGGIILDQSMMAIPIDDHMVHRGHGVFDTSTISDGYLYELDSHLDRILTSASKAKIDSPFPRETLRDILIQMTAASKCKNGSIKYWLSAGPGDFLLSPKGCTGPAFYAIVIAAATSRRSQRKEGVKAITTTVPMKHPFFAGMKSVNYLPNALAMMEAEERGAYASVWVDEEGYVAEGPMMNVAFVTVSGELVLPAFDKILSGCTAKRLLALAPKLVEAGLLKSVKAASVSDDEARQCAEMMFLGSGLPLLPIVEWDGKPVGDGQAGKISLALSGLLWDDLESGPDRIPVPYG
ncbi:D-amino-acid transaminase, chloroplastic-like isoform X1 [Phragmites australis]|uniref:D-amino-acid transaminase, chloroplastic-like isoform X1 n=1 Tax=Phragmites australis TaxID=29695 RepID=UPI002D783DA4|nr:D-amino-acid transaminase, chloroplastic-like isoform X1 [Phragmites australis]